MRTRSPLFLLLLLLGCDEAVGAPPAPPAARTAPTPAIVEPIFQQGLQGEWEDHGWADRKPRTGGGEKLVLSGYGGWTLNRWALAGDFGGLVFRYRASKTYGDFLEVRVDSDTADIFPRVKVGPAHRKDAQGAWTEVFISMAELNPTLAPFHRVVLRAHQALPAPGLVEVDGLGLTAASAELKAEAARRLTAPGTPVAMTVDCTAPSHPISPQVYGIAFSALREHEDAHQWKLNPGARRWGGNPTSRFNWELGAAWNTASDYFFANVDYVRRDGWTWASFLEVNKDRNVPTALTVPMLGWVARDKTSVSFPVDVYGAQQQVDPDRPNAGNGVAAGTGRALAAGNPTRTSVTAPPEFVGRWVEAIKALEKKRGRVVHQYILDNEPALWHDTHRDVHPKPVTYDELLDRTIRYGTAIRKADPQAVIAGPAEWGWAGYLYSAADAAAGFFVKPDRRAHGDVPLIEWYLAKLKAHEDKTGVRVLDVLDLHYYPQAPGMGVGTDGRTDADSNALRLRATRSLWDPKYVDESWVKEPVKLLPRMQAWVDRHYPGLKLSIGEYNFGAERHLSGGLALAEALGRFGEAGVHSAFYWTYPPENSPAFHAFRAFRDFDGKGATFESHSLATTAPRDTSLFAARSADGKRLTLVALNLSPKEHFDARVTLKGCGEVAGQRVFTFTGDPRGLLEQPAALGAAYRLPAYSINAVELRLGEAAK